MLPGVGIFGYDPTAKVLIQLLTHFGFEIQAIWTNNYEIDVNLNSNVLINGSSETLNIRKELITTSIDFVLLNKNVNLVFVCCQPSLHSQICTKALGIGKNVIVLFPTCKNDEDINHMINSAYYYPTLISSVSYGGLRYLNEFKQMKDSLKLIGDVKLCNINISCKNLIGFYEYNDELLSLLDHQHNDSSSSTTSSSSSSTTSISSASTSSPSPPISNSNNMKLNKILSQIYTNWNADRNLGAGVLNRFGAAIISLILFIFDNKKVTKVNGTCRTLMKSLNLDLSNLDENNNNRNLLKTATALNSVGGIGSGILINKTRQITADDYCTFQLNLEPNSIIVNVTINSLAQCRYKQEMLLVGTNGTLVLDNQKLSYRSNNLINGETGGGSSSSNSDYYCNVIEREIYNNENDSFQSLFQNSFLNQSIETIYPELPLIFIKGLFYYLENVKEKFLKVNNNNSGDEVTLSTAAVSCLDSFEHTKIVQLIINNIYLSSEQQKWINVTTTATATGK